MGITKKLQKRRKKLWEQDPHCFWCGRKTVLPIPGKSKQKLPDFLATIDHLDDRYSPERGTRSGEERTVLACRKCNQNRATVRNASMPKEVLWERSGRAPRK